MVMGCRVSKHLVVCAGVPVAWTWFADGCRSWYVARWGRKHGVGSVVVEGGQAANETAWPALAATESHWGEPGYRWLRLVWFGRGRIGPGRAVETCRGRGLPEGKTGPDGRRRRSRGREAVSAANCGFCGGGCSLRVAVRDALAVWRVSVATSPMRVCLSCVAGNTSKTPMTPSPPHVASPGLSPLLLPAGLGHLPHQSTRCHATPRPRPRPHPPTLSS